MFFQLLAALPGCIRAMCVPELDTEVSFLLIWVMFTIMCMCEKSYLVVLRKLQLHLHWHFSLENEYAFETKLATLLAVRCFRLQRFFSA